MRFCVDGVQRFSLPAHLPRSIIWSGWHFSTDNSDNKCCRLRPWSHWKKRILSSGRHELILKWFVHANVTDRACAMSSVYYSATQLRFDRFPHSREAIGWSSSPKAHITAQNVVIKQKQTSFVWGLGLERDYTLSLFVYGANASLLYIDRRKNLGPKLGTRPRRTATLKQRMVQIIRGRRKPRKRIEHNHRSSGAMAVGRHKYLSGLDDSSFSLIWQIPTCL
jgi:hypothetical protein